MVLAHCSSLILQDGMAGETGGRGEGTGRDLPLRATLIPFPGWDPEDPIYNENGALFTSLGLFFSNCNSCIGGFGPFETLVDPFPRGSPRHSPLHLWNHFSSPARRLPARAHAMMRRIPFPFLRMCRMKNGAFKLTPFLAENLFIYLFIPRHQAFPH